MDKDILNGLEKKRILVTGATGGIGSVIVEMFSHFDTDIGIHYSRNHTRAQELKDIIVSNGSRGEILCADLTQVPEIQRIVEDFVSRYGGIDILINNAGAIIGNQGFLDLDVDSWDETFALNSRAPFVIIQKVFPIMKNQGAGRIINISSISAKYGGSSASIHYACTKASLDCLTVGIAREGAPYNILVNSIRAGFIDTPVHNKNNRSADDIQKRINKIPLKRAGKPQDIARMVLFLASDSGDYITGEIFTVAGGD